MKLVSLKAGQNGGTAGPIDVIEGRDISAEIEANFVNEVMKAFSLKRDTRVVVSEFEIGR